MKTAVSASLIHLLLLTTAPGQTPTTRSTAAESIQLSQPEQTASQARELRIPAGTPLEIECTYSVSSLDVRPQDLISFRVLVPVKVDGITVIDKDSLVTGRVVEAKRGGHWGKAGKLSWIMQDVVATDLTRVPLQARNDRASGASGVKGTSHGAQVATQMIVLGALIWPIAPVVLMGGFRRGENAVLPEGKRFIVFVKIDTLVHVK